MLVLAGALVACRSQLPPAGLAPVLDLIAELPAAEVRREVAEIDFGTQSARAHFVSGFSWDEGGGDERSPTFVWGVGAESVLRFYLAAPRALRLGLRGWPFAPEGAPGQEVTVVVGGRPIRRVGLARGAQEIVVELPAGALVAGENRLELRYRRAISPATLGLSDDRRQLAVAWQRLILSPVESAAGPSVTGADLRLASGGETAFHAELPAGSWLAFDSVRARSEGGATVAVEVQVEGRPLRQVAKLTADGRAHAVDLGLDARRLTRLTLRVTKEVTAGPATVELSRPRVLGPRGARALAVSTIDVERGEAAPTAVPRETSGARPNLLVFLVDTLRADRLGVYGSQRGLTPAVDAFASGAVVFERAYAESPWTKPSVASLLTGLPALAHGATTLEARLPEAVLTLPERLRTAGYATAAFSTNWHVTAETGLAQGFDEFDFDPELPAADIVVGRVVGWLDRRPRDRPFFLYVHILDPHAPYEPPADLRRRFAPGVVETDAGSREKLKRLYAATGDRRQELLREVRPLYDAEVAAADRGFGALLAALAERGLSTETMVVFVADHGEEFDEHGALGHANDLYDEVLRVPLLVRAPGAERPERRRELVQLADLAPTLLAAAGVAVDLALPGVDLLAGVPGASDGRFAISHLDYDQRRQLSVVFGGWKVIVPLDQDMGAASELYDLEHDPGELRDRASADPVRAGFLRGAARRHLARYQGVAPTERVPEDVERERALRALGYL